MNRPPTIRDVAATAGVSPATVSRVMNGSASVDVALAQRVQTAAADLGYVGNMVARHLATGRTQTIGLLVPDLGNPTFQAALRGLSHAAARADYRVVVADSEENVDEEAILAAELRRRCDALVLCAPRMPVEDLERLVPTLDPVVLVNRRGVGGAPSLRVDYAAGVRALVGHLTSLGHRRLAFLAGPPLSVSNRVRAQELRRLVAVDGLELTEIPCGAMFEDGHAAGPAALASGATGIVCYNDLVAMGLLGALTETGVAVPDAVSVVGFDDIPFARYASPPLTTMSVPQAELGAAAWERVAALLAGREAGHDVAFLPRLEARGSTGAAPAAAG
ncbi:transcriptional regulator, LacI family [Beutenbergia cavernae DSM 12333]|uniref:Transcriptional regulator, LacI family n=1 Tax=Beutenbergia cavernae (strain ATCC BAA-8 / DSM 12333 / CCUG 43141 / JCM 11478 / NBRC 16432 / NCIMB 13614 / HKI 0122) TaxID=471853 RepID=C5BYU7_BEUC1|nr:LacI family DNA-binding transcriptional regulator [Beutenbergia cavernae]ACQ79055.1 transcriptional regulator, LacI family [Beutenbergia cavernae DSM 12333]